uniref:RAD51 interacting motif domain-containing protein n=1 Tax=Jaculus jaculus TaxID=51337 RepID=A0A8C5KF34_JACJA
MALRRPSPQSAAPAGRLPSGGSPAHADSPPPRSKRPRLDEPGGVGAAGRWPPQVDMLVPGAPSLVPEDVALPQPPAPSAGSPAWADPSAPPRGQTRSCGQPRPPERAGCSRAPERSEERRARDGLAPAVSLGAALCCEEGQAAPHGVNGASKADRVMPSSEKEKSVSPSVLKVSKFENPRNLETSKPSYFRDSITITIPHFPEDLNSNVSFVYLKEKAKKRNDKFVAYVRDFTNIYWSQNRPDAKKRKLQDDKKIVVVENDFSDSYESNQPLNNQNNFEAKRGLISINYYHHNGIKYNVRDFKKNFILTIENDNWEEAEMNSYSYIPTRLGKSQNWDNNVHPILQRKSKDCWIMENVKTNCENMKKLTENLNLNFSCFLRTENDCELQESSIFKWIVQNYLENILMESHTVCLKSILTFSRLFENNLKPNSRKRKLLNTGQALDKSKKQNINSFSVTTKNKSFEIFETYKFFPILMDFDNIEESTLTRESSYENSSHPEQFVDVENWSPYSFNIVNTHVKSGPEFTQNSHRHINEINMNDHDSCTKRKQKHKTSHFNFKFVFEDVFSVKKWVMSSSQNTTHEQMKAMTVTQESSCESLSSEIEEKTYDFIWEKDVKAKAQGLTNSCQLRKDNKMEKEEKDSFPSMDGTYSVQSISLLSKKASVEETQPANKNNGADGNEDKSILHECELANSKYFYPKNDSILYVNCQFESDSSEENNERFQDLTAECLSTEALTIAKDFQMKSKFDLVLEELRMFHEISKENEMLSSVAIYNRKENYLGASNDSEKAKVASQKDLKVAETNTIYISSLSCDMKAGSNMHKKHQSLFKWKAVPNNGEQEATNEYCYPAGPEEELLHATSKEDFKKLPKRRAFCIDECKEEIYNCSCFSHGISRVQPLKTCSRPIRVGLSRKATLKQLHPYLK